MSERPSPSPTLAELAAVVESVPKAVAITLISTPEGVRGKALLFAHPDDFERLKAALDSEARTEPGSRVGVCGCVFCQHGGSCETDLCPPAEEVEEQRAIPKAKAGPDEVSAGLREVAEDSGLR